MRSMKISFCLMNSSKFFKQSLASFRRGVLRALIPEFVWPQVVDVDGVKFRVRGEPYSFATKKLLAFGTESYEADERRLVSHFLAPGMVVFELGGSIGVLSSIIADKIGPTGKLITVEASKKIGRHTKRWIEKQYPWVTVLIGAGLPVWDCAPLGLKVDGFDESRGSLGGSVVFGAVAHYGVDRSGGSPSEIWDLSRLAGQSRAPVDALIVDIEAGEEEILRTALDFPSSLDWVMIELHPKKYREASTANLVLERIEDQGFEVHSSRGNTYLLRRAR